MGAKNNKSREFSLLRPYHEVTVETRRAARKNCLLLASVQKSECMHEADHRQSVHIQSGAHLRIKQLANYSLI